MMDDGRMTSRAALHAHTAAPTAELARLFALAGDDTRLELLQLVMNQEHCVTQCMEHLGLTHSAVSKQLTALADAGLLSRRPSGRRTYYRVLDADDVTRLLDAARCLLEKRPR